VVLNGEDITRARPDVRARRGLSRSFQDARLYGGLTVHQCIAVAADRQAGLATVAAAHGTVRERAAERRASLRADELIDLTGLGRFRDKFVSELSTGSRRIVDLACQVALSPDVVLLDEPSSGIAQREAEALGPLLQKVRDATGASLLVIEHDMPLLTGLADRVLALDLGRLVVEGAPEEVLGDARVIASYLGTEEAVIRRSGPVGDMPEAVR